MTDLRGNHHFVSLLQTNTQVCFPKPLYRYFLGDIHLKKRK